MPHRWRRKASRIGPRRQQIVTVASVLLLIATSSAPASSTEGPLVEWVRENAVPLTTVEPGAGFEDLQGLRPLLESTRVVALGEPLHGAHEPLALRNRLFEFLVEELGYTAIAVETGFTEAWAVDDYVLGRTSDPSVAQRVFHHEPETWAENRQLIDWMREYNSRPSTTRPIRFYGFDLSGSRSYQIGAPRIAIDAALEYIDRVDAALANRFRKDLAPLLPRFNSDGYAKLEPAERNALTVTLSSLVMALRRERWALIAETGPSDYERAYREALVAQGVDAFLRATSATPPDWRSASVRDELMASHVEWILRREGEESRVFVFTHNLHVRVSPFWPSASPENDAVISMGQYLRPTLREELVVIGTTFGGGRDGDEKLYERADPASVDGLLGRIDVPLFGLKVRSTWIPEDVRAELGSFRRKRQNHQYGEVDVTTAFDALVYFGELTPVVPASK